MEVAVLFLYSERAHVMQDDDPSVRQQQLRKVNAAFVQLMATELLTIRVDLESPQVLWGAAAGLGISWLDLVVIGRRFPRVRELPFRPQLAHHVAFGVVVASMLRGRDSDGNTG